MLRWVVLLFVVMMAVLGGWLFWFWRGKQREHQTKVSRGAKMQKDVPLFHFGVLILAIVLILGAVGREASKLLSGQNTWQAVVLLLVGIAFLGADLYIIYSLCLLYTSDAADDLLCVDLGGRRIIKKKKKK